MMMINFHDELPITCKIFFYLMWNALYMILAQITLSHWRLNAKILRQPLCLYPRVINHSHCKLNHNIHLVHYLRIYVTDLPSPWELLWKCQHVTMMHSCKHYYCSGKKGVCRML